jgi:hypothetical protein
MGQLKTKKYWVEETGFLNNGIQFTSDNKKQCIAFAFAYRKKGRAVVRKDGFIGSSVIWRNFS